MHHSPIRVSGLAVVSFLAFPVLASPQQVGEVEIEKQTYETAKGETISFELGTLYVPENRADPKSRVIGVGFARFPATERPAKSLPVFLLPGGPGGSFVSRLKAGDKRRRDAVFASFTRFRHFSDIVLVDQRGFSQHGDVLRATFQPKRTKRRGLPTAADRVAQFKEFAKATAARYAKRKEDLRGYTVIECAHDVDQLTKALGYDKIILNGTSFGSQWSFAVMRLHPEIVARALLSGVEPLDHGYDMPSYVFAAVQRMWMAIDADDRFKPYLPKGGMAEAARVVIERLERKPLKIQQDGGTVAELGPDAFPWSRPTQILQMFHGRTENLQRLAWRKSRASRMPQNVPLIGILIDTSLGVTPQRRHRMWTDPATRYLGRANFAMYLETADLWPSPDVGDEFRTPVRCEIPVVFAQGDWDTKTPLENTFEIAPFFVNSRVLIAERGGHGVLEPIARELPKVWKELEEFVKNGDQKGIPARVRLRPSQSFSPPSFPPPKR